MRTSHGTVAWGGIALMAWMGCTGAEQVPPAGALDGGQAPTTTGVQGEAGTPGATADGAAAGAMAGHEHRAGMIHDAGSHVMPFSLEETLHVFEMTVDGGVQDVVVREAGNVEQMELIRQHLRDEAERFARGDFSDPASLHGADMPGLAELAEGAGRLEVAYIDLPDGGRITYSSSDPILVTAIHRWFGAQLSDHAGDATYR